MNTLNIANATTDIDQFVTQFQDALQESEVWKGTLTTQTSTALIQLVSTIGTFNNATLLRYYEDAFPDTVQSDGAIRAIATMQGIRLTRKLPSSITVRLLATENVTIGPYTQFNVGGELFFNNKLINLAANIETDIEVYQGEIRIVQVKGLGTNLQSFLSNEGDFSVSDRDVIVMLNNTIIEKAYGGLWNYKDVNAYADLTHPDGRLIIQFGSDRYGAVPSVNDVVTVVYVLTQGSNGNSLVTINKKVTVTGLVSIKGVALMNPTGGADEKNTIAYKNVESGAFGTYSSAVTKAQYAAVVNTYPGIIDAKTQAQREINPRSVKWMNIVRVSALTSSEWTVEQKRAFCKYMQDVTMYSPYFLWQDPIAVPRDIELEVFCFNTAIPSVVKAKVEYGVQSLFEAQPGLLMTNFYESDLVEAAFNAAPGEISYVRVVSPASGEMIVTAPESPQPEAMVVPGAGILTPLVYAYGVSVVHENGEEGAPTNWVFPQVVTGFTASIILTWPENKSAAYYKLYGRQAGAIGLLATLPAGTLTWTDMGDTTPAGDPPNLIAEVPIRYNTLRSLNVEVKFSDRQNRVNLG